MKKMKLSLADIIIAGICYERKREDITEKLNCRRVGCHSCWLHTFFVTKLSSIEAGVYENDFGFYYFKLKR